jgi:hypothetical protein
MARAPNVEDLPEVGLRNTRDIVPIPERTALNAAIETTDAVRDVVGRIADAQNELALAQADTESAVALDGIRRRYETDDDWETAPTRARLEAETLLRGRGQELRGDATRRAWAQRSSDVLGRFDLAMGAQSRARGQALARANLLRLGETAEATAGDLGNDESTRELAVRNYAGAIDRAEELGLIDPDDAVRLQTAFSERVRGRVQDGLRAEIVERLDLDPAELADDLADPESDFRTLDPDERARYQRQAAANASGQAVDRALQHTLRTGEILSEDAIGVDWTALGDGARIQYASRVASMASAHAYAVASGDLAGRSLAEIMAAADEGESVRGRSARGHLLAARADPPGYVAATQPNVAFLRDRLHDAVAAAEAAPDDTDLRRRAVEARRAYANAQINAQSALGLSSGDIRVIDPAAITRWVRLVRGRLSPEQQEVQLSNLYERLEELYGGSLDGRDDLVDRVYSEFLEGYANAPLTTATTAPDPASVAAEGADYGVVRDQIARMIRSGGDLDDPRIDAALGRLNDADRNRLMRDPVIAEALSQSP